MKLNNFFSILFLLPPVLLVSYLFLVIDANGEPQKAWLYGLMPWKTYLSYALLFYSLTIFFIREYEVKNKVQIKVAKSFFIAGIILSLFSYAIGGFIVDLLVVFQKISQNI